MRAFLLAASGLALIGGALIAIALFRPNYDELLKEAQAAFDAKDYALCEALAMKALNRESDGVAALALAGAAAAQQSNFKRAMEFYDRLPEDGNRDALNANCVAAHLLMFELARPSAAEARLRAVLRHNPRHRLANNVLVGLLGLSGRRQEAIPYLLELMRQDRFTVHQLVLLGAIGGAQHDAALLKKWERNSPEDPAVLQALAWREMSENNFQAAETHLRTATEINPLAVEAQVRLGSILLQSSSWAEFERWHASAPAEINEDPRTWGLRGTWAQRQGKPRVAVRCFWEAVHRDPNYQMANYQLGQLLLALGKDEQAQPFLERHRQLLVLHEIETRLLNAEQDSLQPLIEIIEQMESLGRLWEAWGWARMTQQIDRTAGWAAERAARLRRALRGNPPVTLATHNPALAVDLSDYPLPAAVAAPQEASPTSSTGRRHLVTFTDDAPGAGLRFTYFNDGDPHTPGQFMYEFGGGGVAALDYDADGRPDLYFTQGCAWSARHDQQLYLDRLFRNRGDGQFTDVTEPAGLVEDRYSQGVAAGDFNNDGFADLFVSNIGRNRLFLNNGDGTFTDFTAQAGMTLDRWTTSALIADMNGDTWPDIVAVNYLEGDDVFERLCRHADGVPRMCTPLDFDGSQDEVYLSLGDGRFRNVAAEAGFEVPDGKGLGILAADFDGNGLLNLFVANDLAANFYFVNQTPERGGFPRFDEQALPLGLAFDEQGRAQGCMGIAVGDADFDERLDLFVTNFLEETNAYYVQQDGGFFRDESQRAGLAIPSLSELGFGTQFIDGDLDGALDLIVTNGHVDDHRDYDQPYKMPPQYFRNRGDGTFQEVPGDELGPFFEDVYLGRGMARLDWNRDGLEDVAISHLDSPAALLTNASDAPGHFLAVKLVGTESSRDAIGTTVTITCGGRALVRQMTAGDGYQASNQRLLVFGLGANTVVERIEVLWPSGRRQEWSHVAADQHLLIVENLERPLNERSILETAAVRSR